MKNTIEQSVTIKASATWIWKALTDASELENWWSEDVVLEAKVGGSFREPWEDDDGKAQLASGKVTSVKKEKSIAFTWREKNWPKDITTQCQFTIEDQGSTRVFTVTHQGWDAFPEPQRKELMKDFKVGWSYHLKELKSYLDD